MNDENITDPVQPEPTKSEPTKSEPTQLEPTESSTVESATTESASTEQTPTESKPTKSEPTKPEPTKSEPTKSEPPESVEPKPENQHDVYAGIVGDSTNHDIVMTRLWISNDNIENIEIKVIGSEFTKSAATRAVEQLKGKTIGDAVFIADFDSDKEVDGRCCNLDIVYESIIQAFIDLHISRKNPESPKIDVEPAANNDSSEEKSVEQTEP